MRHNDKEEYYDPIQARWEFVGKIADEAIRNRYCGRSVADYFPKGAQNPILYVNC
jgi:hypothetical protein